MYIRYGFMRHWFINIMQAFKCQKSTSKFSMNIFLTFWHYTHSSEKPLSINEKQSRKLFETAKAKGLFFAEAIWSRYFESYKLLRQRVDNNDLGDIKEIELEFGFPLANTERLFLKNGGGSTLDLAIYTIQLSLWVFRSEPIKVMAFGKLNEDGLDMELTGEYHFSNGGITKFKVSCLNGLSNTAIIKGTKGQITVRIVECLTLI